MKRALKSAFAFALIWSCDAQAQDLGSMLREFDQSTATRIIHAVIGIGFLSLVPMFLVVTTSFTRIIIVLSILRMSMGLQSTPANFVLISLALFMTFHIMTPVIDKTMADAYRPYVSSEIKEDEAIDRASKILGAFMKRHIREKDLALFIEMSGQPGGRKMDENDFRVLAPSFMSSELRRGFEIGFLIAIPFLLIDIIVATVVMSMGMMMMPPSVISLPMKIMFFILIDGWNLIAGTLMKSFI